MEAIKKIELNKVAKIISVALLGTLLLTISAKVKIPFFPIPMTMQTFVVLFIGITLGPKIGLLTISLYLLEGIFGLPVFAGTPEKGIGFVYFTGPTMGYLIGFLIATYIAGTFKYKNIFTHLTIMEVTLNVLSNFIKLVIAVSLIYIFGLLWLGFLLGWDKPIFQLGMLPFLPAELFKLLILSIISGSLGKIKKII